MSETSLSGGDGRQATAGTASPSRQSRLSAAADVWHAWLFAVVAFAVGLYFFTHPGIWENEAERWYVIIGGGSGVLALVYAAYSIYSRPRIE